MSAAALPRRSPPDPRFLQRCLLLALLLHVWLVLVFGNATGTATPGNGVWGSLTVKLLGTRGGEPGAPPGDPARESGDNAAPNEGRQPRTTAPTTTAPRAAEPGRRHVRDVPPEQDRADEVSATPPATATLKLPEGFRAVEQEAVTAPPRQLAPTESSVLPLAPAGVTRPVPVAPVQPPAAELPAAVGRLETRPDAAVELLPRAAELRPAPVPATAAPSTELPPPVRRLEAPAATGLTTPLPRPAELRSAPPAISAQPAPSTTLPAPVQRLEAPSPADGGITPLTRATGLRTPGAAAAQPSAMPNAQDLPAPVRRLEAADGGVTPLQPIASPRAMPAAPGAAAWPELSGALPGQVATPSDTPAAASAFPARNDPGGSPQAAPRTSAGSPDAGSRLGPDLAGPPSAAASATRAPLNLSLPRRGDIASRRGPGLVELLPQPPERKSKLEQSIEDATNADCRKAYANAGLLAAVPLALDAARGKGCKW